MSVGVELGADLSTGVELLQLQQAVIRQDGLAPDTAHRVHA